jgi:hypothetical protein
MNCDDLISAENCANFGAKLAGGKNIAVHGHLTLRPHLPIIIVISGIEGNDPIKGCTCMTLM